MIIAPQQFIDFNSLIQELTAFGYKILIFALVVALGYLIGRIAGAIIGKIVSRLGADATLRKTGVGHVILKFGFTAADFFKTVTKWSIYIVSVLLALETLNVSYIEEPVMAMLVFMPKFVGAIITFVFGAIISDWIGEFVKKSFSQEERQFLFIDLMGNLLKVFLFFVVITITLTQIGIDVTVLNNIAQAFAWGFAIFMGITAGIIAGWLFKERFKVLLEK